MPRIMSGTQPSAATRLGELARAGAEVVPRHHLALGHAREPIECSRERIDRERDVLLARQLVRVMRDAAVQRADEEHRRVRHEHRVVAGARDEPRRVRQHRGERIAHRHRVASPARLRSRCRRSAGRAGRDRRSVRRRRPSRAPARRWSRSARPRSRRRSRRVAFTAQSRTWSMKRAASTSASSLASIGVVPAWSARPSNTTSAARLPGDRGDDAERLAEPLEHGPLLDVHLEVGVGRRTRSSGCPSAPTPRRGTRRRRAAGRAGGRPPRSRRRRRARRRTCRRSGRCRGASRPTHARRRATRTGCPRRRA